MNEAEELLHRMHVIGTPGHDSFRVASEPEGDLADLFSPDVRFDLFGPSGTREALIGRDAVFGFIGRCAAALAGREDEILSITGIDEECAFVRARAWRKSKATGEELRYEWAMLYRVENGRITYGADMLDTDAQAFWGRIHG